MTKISANGDTPFMPRSASVSGVQPVGQVIRHAKYVGFGGFGVWRYGVPQAIQEILSRDVRVGSIDFHGLAGSP